jgi:hypothetical protein
MSSRYKQETRSFTGGEVTAAIAPPGVLYSDSAKEWRICIPFIVRDGRTASRGGGGAPAYGQPNLQLHRRQGLPESLLDSAAAKSVYFRTASGWQRQRSPS